MLFILLVWLLGEVELALQVEDRKKKILIHVALIDLCSYKETQQRSTKINQVWLLCESARTWMWLVTCKDWRWV